LRRFCWAVLLVTWLIGSSWAQESISAGRNEIAGTFGHTFISDQGVPNSGLADSIVSHGKGWSFELNYARILFSTDWFDLAAEVPAIFNPDEDLFYVTNQVPLQYGSFFVTPAARVRFFPGLAFSPWVSFGGGFGHFSASSRLLFFGSNTGNRSNATGVLQGGVGFDSHLPKLSNRFRLRFEARDDWSGVPPINVNTGKTRQHNYYVAGGMVFAF
jgi:hypothetical protein